MSILLLAAFGAAMLVVVLALLWIESHDEHARQARIQAAQPLAAPAGPSGLLPA